MRRYAIEIYIIELGDVSMLKKKIVDRIRFNMMEKKEREKTQDIISSIL
jgi:hypothetical protein